MPSTNDNSSNGSERPEISTTATFFLGLSIMALFFLTAYYIYTIWPTATNPDDKAISKGLFEDGIISEQRMLILVLLAGMLGSLIHAAGSFSNYVGDKRLDKSWVWWYVLRPLIGTAVALVFYLVFRGGLLTNTALENLNVYGIMTLAALAGLFSDRATLKLKEIFETLFKPTDNRAGALKEDDGKKTS